MLFSIFQFHDGVYLVLLMGLLEGYFVPLYDFHLTPETFDHKVGPYCYTLFCFTFRSDQTWYSAQYLKNTGCKYIG